MARNILKNKIQYKFYAYGHPNIIGTHKTTFEFTKDKDVSLRGDCIIGVNATFELKELKNFIKTSKNRFIKITIQAISNTKIRETVFAELNVGYNSQTEFVVRKTDFVSDRTLAIKSNKAAFELNRELIDFLKEKKSKVSVIIENKQN